jgi:hypothetical protein
MAARLLLLPGLGADERLFSELGKLDLPLVCARLPVPYEYESLTTYALRVAAQLELRPEDWIGGASFGSLVAADIARRRPLAGLVLIGGALSAESLTPATRGLMRLAGLLPAPLWLPLLRLPPALSLAFGTLETRHQRLIAAMLAATPGALMREGPRLILHYRPSLPVLCPVHAIHGGADRLMRPPPLPQRRVISRAGHALVLTHARAVTEFLNRILARPAQPAEPPAQFV